MCGIAGVIGREAATDTAEVVRSMTTALARRGPDGEGLHQWGAAVIAHRRLSIYDLSSAGSQPMISPDGLVGVTFNGAVYNFPDLRRELEPHFQFRSRTDTEVLLHGYVHWGIEALVKRLRGMFAFGIWDQRTRELHLVRDRLGVKPLVYAQRSDGSIAFASTVRALRHAAETPELSETAVLEFLEFGFVPDSQAIYRRMAKVPPGTILTWANGSVNIRRYWSLPEPGSGPAISFDEAVEETERLVLEATQLRLFADVPVGSLLSGGIDSALVCWAAAKSGADITAYTVGIPGDEADETSGARVAARAIGIRHELLPMTAGDAPGPSDLVHAYGEPFAVGSALGMIGVSRLVRTMAKCLLTGDGGDDVFLGYPEHLYFARAQSLAGWMPPGATAAWKVAGGLLPDSGNVRRLRNFVSYAVGGLPAVAAARDGLPFYQRHGLLGDRLAGLGLERRSRAWDAVSARNLMKEFLNYDQVTRFTGEYLPKVDGATMFHALEARAPFLDQELWNFAAGLPVELRLHAGQAKAILRRLAEKHLGPEVARAPKRGFSVPVQTWLAREWAPQVREVFADSLLEREGWIRTRPTAPLLGQPGTVAPVQLWRLYVLEQWLRHERSAA